MTDPHLFPAPSRSTPTSHQRNADKLARIPISVQQPPTLLPKPSWIRVKAADYAATLEIKQLLRKQGLHSVCEEAACPNLNECFSSGTATFMIMGDLCTRRCPFCDVAHGKPPALNPQEPQQLASAIANLKLRYVVITSVNRDDLRDGGSAHFSDCIAAIRRSNPSVRIEILTPDFRGRIPLALKTLSTNLPDVFNHNLETVPRLYPQTRPGADYQGSLELLKQFRLSYPHIPTKSGIMLGLGETLDEVRITLQDLKQHGCTMLTIGQYLQPSRDHLPVVRYVTPNEFTDLSEYAKQLGFISVASAPLVRSSYHAEQQANQ